MSSISGGRGSHISGGPFDGGGVGAAIGDTVADPRLKVVGDGNEDVGLFYDPALGIGTAGGDGHRTHAIQFGDLDTATWDIYAALADDEIHREPYEWPEGAWWAPQLPEGSPTPPPTGTVAAYGEHDVENPFTQLRLKAGVNSYLEFAIFDDNDLFPNAVDEPAFWANGSGRALINSPHTLHIAAQRIAIDPDWELDYLRTNGQMVATAEIPVYVATTAAGTLATSFAGGEVIDGQGIFVGNRILIKNQADPVENGVYVVTAGAPVRARMGLDWTRDNAHVLVLKGTTNGRKTFVCTTIDFVPDTDSINFVSLMDWVGGSPVVRAELLGSEIPTAGADLGDANATITIAGGAQYILPAATLTANRVITLGVTGSPITGETIAILRRGTEAFTLTVQDDAATSLLVMPASMRLAAYFRFNGTHFVLASAIRIQ